jgi:translation initiation factor 2 subunit 1
LSEFPEPGEVVIGRIVKVLDYGVFIELIEYECLQGFVHISNVSSSWVKNIRNFVKEGQIRAGKVLNVDLNKRQIDISLTKVSSNQQRTKIEEYKQAKRTQKLIELLAQNEGVDFEIAWNEVAEPLLEEYDSLYDAFQKILLDPEKCLSKIPEKWVAPLKEIVEKNIEVPVKTVKGNIVVFVPGPSGVESLKSVLGEAEKRAKGKVKMSYQGSGKFQLKANSSDYKSAERLLKDFSDDLISSVKGVGGKAEFEKQAA